jgi:hypothetical protein
LRIVPELDLDEDRPIDEPTDAWWRRAERPLNVAEERLRNSDSASPSELDIETADDGLDSLRLPCEALGVVVV